MLNETSGERTMSKLTQMSFKNVMKHLDNSHLVFDKAAYGLCVEQRSPGRGFVAKLMLRYQDASRDREVTYGRYAPAVCAILPESERATYEAIVRKAKHEKDPRAKDPNKDAELRATLMLIAHPKSQVIFKDAEIVREAAVQMAIATRTGLDGASMKGAFDKILWNPVVSSAAITDDRLKKAVVSNHNDLTVQAYVEKEPVMHDTWRRHLQLQARRQQNAASMGVGS